jgi:hypothetical protein
VPPPEAEHTAPEDLAEPEATVTLLGLEHRGHAGWAMRVVELPRSRVEAPTRRLEEADISALVVERVRAAAPRLVLGDSP